MTDSCVAEKLSLTPEMATELLQRNQLNRPISDLHVKRITKQIANGKWRFNGDTIKISKDGQVLDGQHRLWACIEANKPILTLIIRDIERDAFTTIDTIKKPRSGADTIALLGSSRHRNTISTALVWLIRWQRNCLEMYRSPEHRIENSDIEAAFENNKTILAAIEHTMKLRQVGNPALLGFIYFVAANRNKELADQFIEALWDPTATPVSHPFYQFRAHLMTRSRKKDPVETIALGFKALNAAAAGKKLSGLKWNNQGNKAEPFPKLLIAPKGLEQAA